MTVARSSKTKTVYALIFIVICCISASAVSHLINATQSRLDIVEQQNRHYTILWKSADKNLRLVMPSDCKKTASEDNYQHWRCDNALYGRSIEISGLPRSDAELLARIDHQGRVQVELLSGNNNVIEVQAPEETSRLKIAASYFKLGVKHILLGFDHLLFVFGLLLILAGWKSLLLAITAFTLAHSITLALSVLNLVQVAIAPVEAVIALSIVFLATEYARQLKGIQGWTSRKPWLVSFSVGLLHGLGFASALKEAGLPDNEVPLALVMFNLGVEIGQIAFVAITLPLIALCTKVFFSHRVRHWARLTAAYSIGGVAAFWFIGRSLSSI